MATHSSLLVWRTPWTEEPGGLQSTGSQKSQTQQHEGGQAKSVALLPLPGWVNPHQSDLPAPWRESRPEG